jgi:hypothetical protein
VPQAQKLISAVKMLRSSGPPLFERGKLAAEGFATEKRLRISSWRENASFVFEFARAG